MMINKRAIALMLPVALSACAATSVKGLQKREPVLVADSARGVASIMGCVSTVWLNLGGTAPKSVPRENGAMLVLGDAIPTLIVDVTTTATGSHLVMHQFKSLWSDDNRHRVEEVRACL